MAAPTLDVRVLTSAPQVVVLTITNNLLEFYFIVELQAALMIQSLSILAACTIDASLENNRTAGMIKLLKTPRKASYYKKIT